MANHRVGASDCCKVPKSAVGEHPIAPAGLPAYRHGMTANHKKKALTFGHLIETVYGVCGNRRARGIIRLAIDAHVVVFREQQRAFDFSGRKALV
jgi:hypothetical protein